MPMTLKGLAEKYKDNQEYGRKTVTHSTTTDAIK